MKTNGNESELRQLIESGTLVVLDKGGACESIVKVVGQSPGRLYSSVTDGDTQWEVMTVRLTISQ